MTRRVEVELLDGRILDLSDLTVDDIVLRLLREGVRPEMVKQTRHFLPQGIRVTPAQAIFALGRKSTTVKNH